MSNAGQYNLEESKILERTSGHLLKQLKEGLWQLVFFYPAPTNCWLIEDAGGLTLVDAGSPWNARVILNVIARIGLPLRHIVITHAHPDHAGSAAAVAKATSATVYAHENELPFLDGRKSMADLPGFWATSAFLKTGKLLGILDPPPCVDLQPLLESHAVGPLQVLHTPGHTPGSISLWAERDYAIFCGDNIIFNSLFLQFGLPWFTLDHKTQSESVRAYENLPARLLLSGHGAAFSGNVAEAMKRLYR
jgi:glyoxylase-like metal-dependent hydrolase (beta-lactamase superfamily II)